MMNKNTPRQSIVILDFGSQYTQLLARRVRECGVYCQILSFRVSKDAFLACNPVGVILSGGPASVTGDQSPQLPAWLFESNLPLLGVCYGMQAMAAALGGEVHCSPISEYGYAKVTQVMATPLFEGLQDGLMGNQPYLDVWMSHGDKVTELPPGFKCIGQTEDAPIAAMAHENQLWFGVQFHPEVTHTPQGKGMLSRFIFEICRAQVNWTHELIRDSLIEEVRAQVGTEHVVLGLSGGVDSSVVAALLHEAIGSQLHCVFVDNGLLRLGEVEEVQALFESCLGVDLTVVDANIQFLNALKGITCPEEKRKKIGHTFIDVFAAHARDMPQVKWLAQGTIYPDVIESAQASLEQTSHVIKSHHNVGGLPEHLPFKLLEPIRNLFKDEVRQLGLDLGLPERVVYRHPFPGPGLGVRVLGEVKAVYLDILRQADAIFIQALRGANLYSQVSQAFAVFLPVKSVGVVGDGRSYEYVICLRAVETQDFMTATWARLPWDFLDEVARQIMNRVKGVSRVTYDISGKPPATIEWE